MRVKKIIERLRSLRNEDNLKGMSRYGINVKDSFGISIYKLRELAKELGNNHELALELWKTGFREARILASYVDEVDKVTESQMDDWVKDFNSWDLCDQVTTGLFDQTSFAWKKAFEWSKRDEEFVKRAAFSLVAGLAVHDKSASDSRFLSFFPVIKRECGDDRNFVWKSVKWSLRNIGKRNKNLNKKSVMFCEELLELKNKTANKIARGALRELKSEKVLKRLK